MSYYDRRVNAPRAKRSTLFSATDRLLLSQNISGWWGSVLTPAEDKIISFIFARTIGWGREWEVITLRHFTDGIEDSSAPGAKHTHGTGLSKPTVCKALAVLVDEGFVSKRVYKDTHQYRLRIDQMGQEQDPVRTRRRANAMAVEQQTDFRTSKTARLRKLWLEYGKACDPAVMVQIKAEEKRKAPRKETLVKEALQVLKVLTLNKEHNPLDKSNGAHPNGCLPRGAQRCPEDSMAIKKRREKKPTRIIPPTDDAEYASDDPTPTNDPTPTAFRRRRPAPRLREDASDNLQTPALLEAARRDLSAPTRVETLGEALQEPSPAIKANEAAKPTDGALESRLSASALIRSAQQRSARKRQETMRKKGPKVNTMREMWNSTHIETYGQAAPAWNAKLRGRVSHLLNTYEVTHADASWLDVVQWYAEDFARATEYAIPFMLRSTDQRDSLLLRLPTPTLLIHFAGEFLAAYLRLHYGVGYSEADHQRAERTHRVHARWCNRQDHLRYHGHDNLPAELQTTGELIDHALTSETPEMVERANTFSAFEQLIADVGNSGGTQADAEDAQRTAMGELDRQARDAAFAANAQALQDDIVETMRATYPGISREDALAMHAEMYGEEE